MNPDDPLYLQLIEQFKLDLANRDAAVAADIANAWQSVGDSLERDLDDLIAMLLRLYGGGRIPRDTDLFELRQYQAFLAQVNEQLDDLLPLVGEGIEAAVAAEVLQAADEAALVTQALAAESGASLSASFTRITPAALENATALARAGMPLRELLDNTYPMTADGITRELLAGIGRGRNGRQIAGAVIENGLSQGLNHILLVARDQANRAYRTAALQQYRDSGVVQQYRRVATRDRRTCMACLMLDGTVYDIDEEMPTHPQDRCAAVPIVDGFVTPNWQTGREWFLLQPKSVQQEMMGKSKYEAWSEGRFELDAIIKITNDRTWGESATPAPLKELL